MSKKNLYVVFITLLSLAVANVCGAAAVPFSVRAFYDAQVADDGSQR
jgi:hypothetical protein